MLKALWTQILTKRKRSLLIGVLALGLVAVALLYLQGDIHRNLLDPKIPFQIYKPPPAPNYGKAEGWYLNPAIARYYADPRKVDVFFLHGTTYNGGRQWLGKVDNFSAEDGVRRIQLPNYAAPFAVMGNVYAPRYRQASLYTQLTLREDAREARQFAYHDVESAFMDFLKTRKGGRGFVIVGVEQGGLLGARLLSDVVAKDPQLKSQLVAAYLIETLVSEDQFGNPSPTIPACMSRQQVGCDIAYLTVDTGRPDLAIQTLSKAVKWSGDVLVSLDSSKPVCVNPLAGTATGETIEARRSLGATNATGLEWGAEPALIARKVSAHCLRGLLFVTTPKSPSFRTTGTWEDRKKVNPYNLFYGDLQADLETRWQAFQTLPKPAPAS